MDNGTTVLEIMHQGGWVMWALLAFSIAGLGAALERAIALRRAGVDISAYVKELRRALVDRNSVSQAMELSRRTKGPVAKVALAGLRRFALSPAQVEKSLERRAVSELRHLHRGLGILATVAGTAPLLGFLGTVTGMIASFDALVHHGMNDPTMVALGIKEALTTTAAGLIVAVPAQLAYNALISRVDRITGDIEAVASFLLEVREESAMPQAS